MSNNRQFQVLGDIPCFYASHSPDAVAVEFEDSTLSFAQLEKRSNQVARALRGAGVQPGAHVAYLGKSCTTFIELLFGAAKARVILVPISWRLAAPEVSHILADTEASLLFQGPDVASQLAAAQAFPDLRVVSIAAPATSGTLSYENWLESHSDTALDERADPTAPVLQLYTSGTTGRPKGVLMSHQNLLLLRQNVDEPAWNQWGPDDVTLVSTPVSHIGGTGTAIRSLSSGGRCLLVREFDPHTTLDLIERAGVTRMFLVPAALKIILEQSRSRSTDFSRLKIIYYGASAIHQDLLKQSLEVFGCSFVQQYGMTETSGTVVMLSPDDHLANDPLLLESAGRPIPGVEVSIMDDTGCHLPPNSIGEVVIRSGANMLGYWMNDAATAEVLDDEGWLHTGDAGSLDEDGYLFIKDRLKDMIISGGENIYPAEVEHAIATHPDVEDVAVVGVPHEKWGEAVKAFIVLKPGAVADPEEIFNWTGQRIARFKLPKTIEFISTLPRNATGKILRGELREHTPA